MKARASVITISLGKTLTARQAVMMIERLWRSLKYECIYLYAFKTGSEARKGIDKWIRRYNEERPHSSLDDRTPHEAYWNLPRAGYPVKLAA